MTLKETINHIYDNNEKQNENKLKIVYMIKIRLFHVISTEQIY